MNGASTASVCRRASTRRAMLGWTGDNGDPDNFLGVLLSCGSAREGGQNIAKWCNKDFTKLIDEAAKTFGRRPSAPSSTSRPR